MRRYDRFALPIAMAVLAAGALWVASTAATAQPPRSLDDELLEGLQSDPLDEVDRELFDPPAAKPGDDSEDHDQRVKQELGAAGVSEESNPLLEIARRMRLVGNRISQNDSGSNTQDLQTGIVKDLNAMIEQARKNCRKCKPGNGQSQPTAQRQQIGQPSPNPGTPGTNPAKDPTGSNPRPPGNGEGVTADLEQVQAVIKDIWGQLPAGVREQMLQSPPEEFLPNYERLIEQYFRRLAEGKGSGE